MRAEGQCLHWQGRPVVHNSSMTIGQVGDATASGRAERIAPGSADTGASTDLYKSGVLAGKLDSQEGN